MPIFLFLLMLGMGATLSVENFRQHLKQPMPGLIGLISQYAWMPLISLVLALTMDLSPPVAMGLILTGCVSGGASSNFFTYIARGDLSLSVSMTVISTLSGLIMIPLVLFIYTAPFTGEAGSSNLEIPNGKIIASLLIMIVPVVLGMELRRRSLIWARRMERAGTIAGFSMIVFIAVGILFRHSDILMQTSSNVYLAGMLLAPMGFAFGYLSASFLNLATPQRRAVSLETGAQNVPLALGIILISFPTVSQPEIMLVPILYGVTVIPFAALMAFLFRRISVAW